MFGYLFVSFIIGWIAGVCVMGVVASSRIDETRTEDLQTYRHCLEDLTGVYLTSVDDLELVAVCEDEELAHAFCKEWGPRLVSNVYLTTIDIPKVITWDELATIPYSITERLSAFIDTEKEGAQE